MSQAADNVKNVVSKAVNARKSDSTGGKPSKRQRQHASPAATQQGKQPTEVMAAPGSRAGSSPTHPHQANIVSRGAHANQSRNIASREGPTRGRPPAGTKEGLMRSQVKAAKQHPSKTREIGQSAAMPERRKKAPPLRGKLFYMPKQLQDVWTVIKLLTDCSVLGGIAVYKAVPISGLARIHFTFCRVCGLHSSLSPGVSPRCRAEDCKCK